MRWLGKMAEKTEDMDSLRGYEGMAGKVYFSRFGRYIKPTRGISFSLKTVTEDHPKTL
jgi:hypothetical protein